MDSNKSFHDFMSKCNSLGGRIFGDEYIPSGTEHKKILFFSHDLSMTGAPLVLVRLAEEVRKQGYVPVIISLKDGPVRSYIISKEICVIICGSISNDPLLDTACAAFDMIVVNTVVLESVVASLNGRNIPVMWWIHELPCLSEKQYYDNLPDLLFSNVRVFTVGQKVKEAVEAYRPNYNPEELLYSVPDIRSRSESDPVCSDPAADDVKHYAVVGTICERKGQDLLIKAVDLLNDEILARSRFVFLGRPAENDPLAEDVMNRVGSDPDHFSFIPEMDPDEMKTFYDGMDVIICPSRYEPMSVVVTEACCMGIPVIISDTTGYAVFFKEKHEELLFRTEDPEDLCRAIAAMDSLDMEDKLRIADDLRKVYEDHFTPELFSDNVSRILKSMSEYAGPDQDDFSEMIRTISAQKKQISDLQAALDRISRESHERMALINKMEGSHSWKVTAPLRAFRSAVHRIFSFGDHNGLIYRGVRSIRHYGVKHAVDRVFHPNKSVQDYSEWMITHRYSEEELSLQRQHTFERKITVSIVVPLYNTPEEFLREMIDSVSVQTYPFWQLCLADGSDSLHDYVGEICTSYAKADPRICYQKLDHNGGISENSNAALAMATGEWISLLDHDDVLSPAALFEVMKAICEKNADMVYTDEATFESPDIGKILRIHFKPDYAPDNLRSNNYICHFTSFEKRLTDECGAFRAGFDGSQDHDLMLRLASVASSIVHIPKVLYYWRAHSGSVAQSIDAKDYALDSGRRAVESSLTENGLFGSVECMEGLTGVYRIRYELAGTPKVSIIIPSCDQPETLRTCIESILNKTAYPDYEIIIAENNSRLPQTFEYYRRLEEGHSNIRVIRFEGPFNYAAVNNRCVREEATGEYVLLLNNDTEIITPEWIDEMMMFAQRKDVGAVGAKLYYPDGTIQHAGVVIGLGGVAGHIFAHVPGDSPGYMAKLGYAQNMSAVTGACMLVKRDVYLEVEGMDPGYALAFNDVDLCMRIRRAGYLIVWTPFAELYHYESATRGIDDTPEKKERFISECEHFKSIWYRELAAGDPYYNPNLSLNVSDYSMN